MINNDILRSLRYSLRLSDVEVMKMFALGGCDLELEEAQAKMGREEEPDALFCEDEELSCFLDGLVVHKRGPREEGSPTPARSLRLTNNMILKKIRVALTLREDEILDILKAGGHPMSRGELSALFRKPQHRSYRGCGDQALRKFLRGLTAWLRVDEMG